MYTKAVVYLFSDKYKNYLHSIRKQYDPLYQKIPNHIDIVYPFVSNISNIDLIHHVKSVIENYLVFYISYHGFKITQDGYLYLEINKGRKILELFYKDLYSGILQPYHDSKKQFIPSPLLGQFKNFNQAKAKIVLLRKQYLKMNIKEKVNALHIIQIKKNELIVEEEIKLKPSSISS